MHARALAATLLAVAAAVSACGQGDAGEGEAVALPDDAVVTYAFHDASVPPPYHRSVTLTVTKDESRIVIDSYGDVLADERTPTTAQVWERLGSTLSTVSAIDVVDAGEACVGGTGIDLTVQAGDVSLVDLSPEFCAGSNEGVETVIDDWIAPARGLFPPTDVLAPEGE